jgi:hypothetical protein
MFIAWTPGIKGCGWQVSVDADIQRAVVSGRPADDDENFLGTERERKRKREREREMWSMVALFLFLKGMMGALAPFCYLVS